MMTQEDYYYIALDHALIDYMQGKEKPFDDFCSEYGLAGQLPTLPVAKRCAIMKMVTARPNLPMWARSSAKRWLVERGFDSWDDGDVVERMDQQHSFPVPNQGKLGSSTAYASANAAMYAMAAGGVLGDDATARVIDAPRPATPKRLEPSVETVEQKRKRFRRLRRK